MNCGSCDFSDKLCYCSMPPQVKCTVTNEFHYYDDECNCEEAIASRKEELEYLKIKLSEPAALAAINYDGPNAPSVSFSRELPEELDSRAFSNYDISAPVAWGATSCLVCGESIQLEGWWDSGLKICHTCKKAVKFIKEKFSKELEAYEV